MGQAAAHHRSHLGARGLAPRPGCVTPTGHRFPFPIRVWLVTGWYLPNRGSHECAAAVLIHEALHYAGLSEQPRDPQGMHARDIDRMVKKACGF